MHRGTVPNEKHMDLHLKLSFGLICQVVHLKLIELLTCINVEGGGRAINELLSFAADTTRHPPVPRDQRPRGVRGGDICQRCELDHLAQIQTVSGPPPGHGAEVRMTYFDNLGLVLGI